MRFSVDFVLGGTVRLSFVGIVESSNSQSNTKEQIIKLERQSAYLNPRSLYATEAAHIMCAPADLPMPWSMNLGKIATLVMFPV